MNSVDRTTTLAFFWDLDNFSHTKMILLSNNVPLPWQDGKHKSSAERDERLITVNTALFLVKRCHFSRLGAVHAAIFPVQRR